MTLREELAVIDSEKRDAHESLSDVVLLSVWTGAGLGAAWLIQIIIVWAYSWMTLGAKVVGGLIVIPPLIWLAWNWFCVWLACVWDLSQPIRFWFRDSFQSLDGCGSKIGTRLIQVLSAMFIFPAFGCTLAFVYTDNSWILLPIPIGILGMAWLSFGGEDWIRRTFAKLDDWDELVENIRQVDDYETNGGSGVVSSVQLSSADLAEKQRLLGVLSGRRARFGRQIDFWERMQDRKYRDIQIIGLTEMGCAYGRQMSMERVDVELLLEVLKATVAEYDRQIAILKEGI